MSNLDVRRLLQEGDRTGLWIKGGALNIPLARKTIEHIEAHPEEHHQEVWVCRTGMCYAGHAATIDGAEFAQKWSLREFVRAPKDSPQEWVHVSEHARNILGLGDGEAARMFTDTNTAEDLRSMVEALDTHGHLAAFGVVYFSDGRSEWYGDTLSGWDSSMERLARC